eukprot:TRINITY_DN23869_c0_g1_i3.p1 TRINITY_DN23869_c0_g1~~TRINITY_DN23869_c0_g1_i3.p1  ORF type:complete len:1005 (-),score=300.47 TRINITY_DN23869_c0_g1_i3:207-3221(-)
MPEETAVAVGVRIRPFNQRELDLGACLCVQVEDTTTILNPPPGGQDDGGKRREPKRFTFDASFWSHDGFLEEPSGYLKPKPGSDYADQNIVFERFGQAVLDNAWAGYHCCLFAYGQTGAGKSYSMVGYGANRGIVPACCQEMFRRITANKDPDLTYEVLVSIIEIYNEQVQDCLIAPKLRPKKGLDINENKQLGIYINGVTKRPVRSYDSIEATMNEGMSNRTVGHTIMNATSSRAHTVLVIEFKQVSQAGGQTGCKMASINLVDLAGSEKTGAMGASGDRFQEGVAINKSLSALGSVIEKLADKATGKAGPAVVVPYRDSKLTRLLQNALGGSSKTVMICAISPASCNYEETLSTLRYADRAKRIKNAAIINENPQDKLIRQLREENARLREMVEQQKSQDHGHLSPLKEAQMQRETAEELNQKKADISKLEQALQEMQRSFDDRLAEAQSQAAAQAKSKEVVDLSLPHITNLNEDELLTNKLIFSFKEGVTHIGRAVAGGAEGDQDESVVEPEVCLAGPGIVEQHARLENSGGKCFLSASEAALEHTVVNGAKATAAAEPFELKHGDRVAFGQSIFVFVDPNQGSAQELLAGGRVCYVDARRELMREQVDEQMKQLKESQQHAEELERLVREAEEAAKKARSDVDDVLKQREEEFRQKMSSLQEQWDRERQLQEEAKASSQEGQKAAAEEQAKAHALELEQLRREFEEGQRMAKEDARERILALEEKAQKAAAQTSDNRSQRDVSRQMLEEEIMAVLPLVKEANWIADDLQWPYKLEARLSLDMVGDTKSGALHVSTAVLKEGRRTADWTLQKLERRVDVLRELWLRCEQDKLLATSVLGGKEDPLCDDDNAEKLIGVAHASLKGLLLQVEGLFSCKIFSTEVLGVETARQVGTLKVELWPCSSEDGTPGVPEDELVDDPEELLGSKMNILVKVVGAQNLPLDLAHDVRIEYDFFLSDTTYRIPAARGSSQNPTFNDAVLDWRSCEELSNDNKSAPSRGPLS